MKITFKKEYINELKDYNSKDSGTIHPDFSINIGMTDDIFDVLGICMENNKASYIIYDWPTFDFLNTKYFDIVDTKIPDTWSIGGFPRNFPFQCSDGTYGRLDHSVYYWGLPIFFSDFDWFGKYYDGDRDCKEKQELNNYLELSKADIDMVFARNDCDINGMIELIQKLT